MASNRTGWVAIVVIFMTAAWMGTLPSALAQPGSHGHSDSASLDEQILIFSLAPREAAENALTPADVFDVGALDVPLQLLVKEDSGINLEPAAAEVYLKLRVVPAIEELKFGLPQTICGTDGRRPITNTTQSPYNVNCLLLMTLPNNMGMARGTGWLIDATTVITAGHCVHDGAGGPFYPSVEVIPGAFVARVNGVDVLQRPYGSQTVSAAQLRASDNWKNSSSMADDYGAILLNAPFSGPSGSPQPFSTAVLTDTDLQNARLHLAGYPGDKPTGTQWEEEGPVAAVEPARLRYMIDTFGGQSGSSVATSIGGRLTTVGIHNYGGCPNRCTRITQGVQTDLQRWQAELAGTGGGNANAGSEPPVHQLRDR